jgi:hypothetical protein
MKSLGSSSKWFYLILCSYRPCDLALTADAVNAATNAPVFVVCPATAALIASLTPDISPFVVNPLTIDGYGNYNCIDHEEVALY